MQEKTIKQYLSTHVPSAVRWEGFKAVMFDMDGVLYDSMPHHAIAWQESMKRFDINMTADDAYATEGARGVDTIRMMVRKQKGKEITEEEAQHMYDVKTDIFHHMEQAPVFDGVLTLMEKIHKAGLSVNVVTGSGQRPLIKRLLSDFGRYLDEDHITTAYDVKRGKPNPDPYLAGLRKAGNLKPWEGIVIENAPLGVKAGVAAGCFTIAVNSGPLPDEQLINAGANILYSKISQVADDFDSMMKICAELVHLKQK
jgi:HAD superfamily hydrolase (TIGR01509 family)